MLLVKHPGFAIKMSKLVDGTSKTFLVGEKHVQDDKFGTQIGLVGNTWDGAPDNCIYNGDYVTQVARFAGQQFPLASNPQEAYNLQFGSWHPGICQFVMADGSVQILANSTDVVVLDRLADRKDGEVVALP